MKPISVILCVLLASCGTLEKQASQISHGDTKTRVIEIMGPPDASEFRGDREALQYCITGAGLGYHDYRVVWLQAGKVTSVTSYKRGTPGVSCSRAFLPLKWDETPK